MKWICSITHLGGCLETHSRHQHLPLRGTPKASPGILGPNSFNIAWVLAGILGAAVPMTALASSPDFARSAEEWATLQDQVLTYEEIPDLIHEYNVTVQNNQYEYNTFVKDYGRTREDIADAYLDLANTLEGSMSGDDSGMAMVSDLQLQLQAKQLREQADDQLEDSQIYYWTYAQAEDNLAQSAQSKFISYYRKQLELASAREEKGNLEQEYALASARRQAGTATDMEVLTAQERIQEQEKTMAELEQSVEDTRQKLIIMLGWNGSDQPEIMGVPEIDLSEIDAMDLEADKQKALETNYTLKTNQKKLENAKDADNRSKLQNTIQGNERQILVSVTNGWQSLQTAKRNYLQAQADAATEERNMELASQKWNAGMITRYEYEKQQTTVNSSRNAVEEAKLDLLEALETYNWNVKGLAAAS